MINIKDGLTFDDILEKKDPDTADEGHGKRAHLPFKRGRRS